MFRLRVWNKDFEEIGTVERPTAGVLLDIGKLLQKEHGAYYRLEYIGEDRKEVDTPQPV